MTPTSPILPLEVDDFHYHSMEQTEQITLYVPGGYHPIVIGDILGPSAENRDRGYRIMHKLGWGAYSTVWLAQKTDSSQAFVAVKVTVAEGDMDLTREAAMLAKAQTSDGTHVLTLLDHFTLCGPNGTHSVLVTDIVVSMFSLISRDRDPRWRKIATHGLAQALASLHATGIVHGDLHIGNFGFAFPQIADQDPYNVMLYSGQHDVIIVLPVSAVDQTPSLPAYVLSPCNLANFYDKIAGKDLSQTKIFDFGSAHEAGALPPRFQCMARACAPELVFARVVQKIDNPPVEPPADVWALGCAIYEIFAFNDQLFKWANMTDLPHRMIIMAGSLPPGWEDWYAKQSDPPEISPTGADAWWVERRKRLRPNCTDDESADALVILLRKMLVLDPALRPTAAEVLEDFQTLGEL